jgi:hypothetical protein
MVFLCRLCAASRPLGVRFSQPLLDHFVGTSQQDRDLEDQSLCSLSKESNVVGMLALTESLGG